MDSDNPLWGLVVILILILIIAIISCIKTALEYVGESNLRKRAEGGDRKATGLLKIIDSDCGYQSTMTLLLCGMAVITGVYYMASLLPRIWISALWNQSTLNFLYSIYIVLSLVLLIFAITLVGLLVPKTLAMKYAEKICFGLYGLIWLTFYLFSPFGWLIEKVMKYTLKIFSIPLNELQENEIDEEIISMVNEGHEQGVFDAGKAEMISNIIELDDLEANDIMTHKKRIIAVNAVMSLEEAVKFMLSENYSRYPLYEGNLDNIIGILHLKDILFAYIFDDKKRGLKDIAREPYFVPDTQSVNLLFHEMQSNNIHMAIVIDEYGQTAGLVAMEDFLEEIVGNIQDEYDKEEKMILSVDEDSCVVKGSISLEDLEEELDIIIEHEDFDTLNGLLISILDRIPADGERATLEYGGYQFDILETMNKMIGLVRISKLSIILEDSLDGTVLD